MGQVYTVPYVNYTGNTIPNGALKFGNWVVTSDPDTPRERGIWTTSSVANVFTTFYEENNYIVALFKSDISAYVYHAYIGYNSGRDNLIWNSTYGVFYGQSQSSKSNGTFDWYVSPFSSFDEALDALLHGVQPEPVTVPITYYPTGCVLQGPSEAEQGDTVNVLVTPGPGKVIKPESIQVYNRSGLITHTYSSGILSFNVPE